MKAMNGAQSLVRTLLAGGIDTCFANPGTSEMHFVAALDQVPGMRCVLCLFEGVATGAADGYARMTGKPAATLLHLGPGLANGLANLHNARKAQVPLVNIVGDHAIYHLYEEAPLTSDVAGFARPVSHWVRSSKAATEVSADGAAAIAAAKSNGGQVATLILPANTAWEEANAAVAVTPAPAPRPLVEDRAVAPIVEVLRSKEAAVLFLGGAGLSERGLHAAGRVAAKTNVRLLAPTSNARIARGVGRVPIPTLPYPLQEAIENLKDVRHLILAGSQRPVAYFAYPGKPAFATPVDCQIHTLVKPEEDVVEALERLAHALDAKSAPHLAQKRLRAEKLSGPMTPESFAAVIAQMIPDQAIVADESLSFGRGLLPATSNSAPHDWLQLTGGAIGIGLPLATGAALACPDRKVMCLQADGSGMYTLQSLWTHAREGLDIVTLILANRTYATLRGELVNVGVTNPGPNALAMLDLHKPILDWTSLAEGMGVEASRAEDTEGLMFQLEKALGRHGPSLIEVVI